MLGYRKEGKKMGRKRLHEDYWILKITTDSIWISNHVGDLIKVKVKNPQKIADWLEGSITDDSEIDLEIINQLKSSRLLIGDFWELKTNYTDVSVIIPKKFQKIAELLLKKTSIENLPIDLCEVIPEFPNKSTLYINVQEKLDPIAISEFDDWAHRYKITWIPMGLIELARLSFGPVIIPFHSPCLECYFNRRKANGNPADVNFRFGYEEIQQSSLSNHEFLLLFGLLLTRIQLGIGVFVQNQSALISSFNRMGLDLVEDEIIFTPRCKRCSSHQFPSVEPYTPISKRLK